MRRILYHRNKEGRRFQRIRKGTGTEESQFILLRNHIAHNPSGAEKELNLNTVTDLNTELDDPHPVRNFKDELFPPHSQLL